MVVLVNDARLENIYWNPKENVKALEEIERGLELTQERPFGRFLKGAFKRGRVVNYIDFDKYGLSLSIRRGRKLSNLRRTIIESGIDFDWKKGHKTSYERFTATQSQILNSLLGTYELNQLSFKTPDLKEIQKNKEKEEKAKKILERRLSRVMREPIQLFSVKDVPFFKDGEYIGTDIGFAWVDDAMDFEDYEYKTHHPDREHEHVRSGEYFNIEFFSGKEITTESLMGLLNTLHTSLLHSHLLREPSKKVSNIQLSIGEPTYTLQIGHGWGYRSQRPEYSKALIDLIKDIPSKDKSDLLGNPLKIESRTFKRRVHISCKDSRGIIREGDFEIITGWGLPIRLNIQTKTQTDQEYVVEAFYNFLKSEIEKRKINLRK